MLHFKFTTGANELRCSLCDCSQIAWQRRNVGKLYISYIKFYYSDVIMSAMASQITGISFAYSTVCSGADQRKHQSSESLYFLGGIHRRPVNSPHKRPVTRKMFPFDDVIMRASRPGKICVSTTWTLSVSEILVLRSFWKRCHNFHSIYYEYSSVISTKD